MSIMAIFDKAEIIICNFELRFQHRPTQDATTTQKTLKAKHVMNDVIRIRYVHSTGTGTYMKMI